MARNLFLLTALVALAGCQTPSQPPSPSGVESAIVTAPAAPATVDAAPAAAPASKKLPLGTVRRK
jgi:uncharacterized lipoprotein YajG